MFQSIDKETRCLKLIGKSWAFTKSFQMDINVFPLDSSNGCARNISGYHRGRTCDLFALFLSRVSWKQKRLQLSTSKKEIKWTLLKFEKTNTQKKRNPKVRFRTKDNILKVHSIPKKIFQIRGLTSKLAQHVTPFDHEKNKKTKQGSSTSSVVLFFL